MKVTKRLWFVGMLLACGLPGMAWAQAEPGVYASLFFGSAESDANADDVGLTALAVYDGFGVQTSVRNPPGLDTKDSGYGFAVGYRLNKWVAVEGGYIDLGDVTYRETSSGNLILANGNLSTPRDFSLKLTSNVAGFTFSALGVVPLTYRLEAYGRVGFLIGSDELDISIRDTTQGGRASADVSESSTETMVGVGLSFSLVEIYSIRAEYLRILDAGSDEISGENDVDLVSLGLTVRF